MESPRRCGTPVPHPDQGRPPLVLASDLVVDPLRLPPWRVDPDVSPTLLPDEPGPVLPDLLPLQDESLQFGFRRDLRLPQGLLAPLLVIDVDAVEEDPLVFPFDLGCQLDVCGGLSHVLQGDPFHYDVVPFGRHLAVTHDVRNPW